MKLRHLASLVVLLTGVVTIDNVAAQPYPSRPIKLVVPYAPGGETFECNIYFGEDLMELSFASPSAAKLD